jgi:hypothetical protein
MSESIVDACRDRCNAERSANLVGLIQRRAKRLEGDVTHQEEIAAKVGEVGMGVNELLPAHLQRGKNAGGLDVSDQVNLAYVF